MRNFWFLVLFLVMVLFGAGAMLAQSTNAAITGQVSDPSKAVLTQAKVTAINNNTNVHYAGVTNQSGTYVIPAVPPGDYRVEVEKAGFKTIVKPDIILHLQDTIELNFEMAVGSASEVVTVTGGASMVNTTDASVSTVIDQSYVQNMPLNGRSFQDLILLTPGTVSPIPQSSYSNTPSGLGATGEFSVNGQRPESNNYSVDGVSANVGATFGQNMEGGAGPSGSVPAATALGTTQALVSVDDLQEFRVQSSSYSAEYGRNPGGQFSFETKAGANQWHGTGYDYLRNGAFDAPDWFNDYFGKSEPTLRQNDFGGTLGGPLEVPGLYHGKDKTFFFVSYEGLRLTAPQAATVSDVPDAALRASAPAALQQALNAFPVQSPNGIDDTTNGIAQFIGTWANPNSLDSTSARFDHVVNDKLRLFFRFSGTSSSSATRGTGDVSPTARQTSAYTLRTYTVGATSMFAAHLGNDFRLNYSSNGVTSDQVITAFGGGVPLNLAQLTGLNAGSNPYILLVYGGYFLQLSQAEQSGAQRQWNLVDTVGISLGRHQFKFGADYRRLAPIAIQSSPSLVFAYLSETAVASNNALSAASVTSPAYPLYMNFSAFAQDEWRVSQRLSLSFGLRWEVNPAPGVTQGLKPYTIQGTSPSDWTLAPQGTPLWRTTWYNFAPRLGVAYILQNVPGRETVARGGGGVFFDTGQQLGSYGFEGPGFSGFSGYQFVSFPVFPAPIPTITNPPVPPYSTIYGFAPHLQLPYTLQWNASIEQALGKSQALTVSYVGAHAKRLLQASQVSGNSNASYFVFVENGLTSDYNSLQVQFRRRLSRGLTALASYTWSHCLDYGSQNYIFGYQRGNCDFDMRHNLSAALSYALPNVRQNDFAGAVLNHWGLDDRFTARTAFPITLLGNELLEPNGKIYDGGLSFVPGPPIYLYGSNCASVLQGIGDLQPGQGCPGGRAINPLAFTAVNTGLGDAPRNFARGFGAWQMDLAVRREFPIHERLKLQFRAEVFNIVNHPNFGTVNPYFGQATFGQATATLANSLGVLSPLYQMGGPRSMQFALKLAF
jgi:hypothetical protein